MPAHVFYLLHMTISTAMRNIPPITLATRLRLAREWRALDQQVLADQVGISRATVSNYETGKTTPGKLELNAWAVICDVDVEWLKTGIVGVGPTGLEPMTSTVESQRLADILPFPTRLAS